MWSVDCRTRCEEPCKPTSQAVVLAKADPWCGLRYMPACRPQCCSPLQVPSYPYYLANEAVQGKQQLEVTDKYSGQVAYRVAVAGPEEISR